MCSRSPNPDAQKKHFVLVHGAGHGAWCWYKLSALLISAGHHVTALDLAASGDNPKQINQVHCFADYVEPLIEFMESLPPEDRVILVGHSMGGASISIAMERFPEKISVAVFATAVMPGPTLSYLAIVKQDLALALSSLRSFPLFDEEIKLTKEKYGLVRRVCIVCDQDLAIGEDVQRWMIKENPPHEVKVINGSDHMPMFSKPQEFFSTLQEITEKYS
ncbi:putative inactive methylesterase 20 isoform X2 [Prunus avium]|uniref:Inactive methylesterase 20 isoform X2 n=1 Tax=Prunus avium TaxID=42229 RepID=A0A6P5RXB6_PRUAV|nr:putative inactive methylesterase 20 isoform X2 [Prunus avium]